MVRKTKKNIVSKLQKAHDNVSRAYRTASKGNYRLAEAHAISASVDLEDAIRLLREA
jgi:hypothetical protein